VGNILSKSACRYQPQRVGIIETHLGHRRAKALLPQTSKDTLCWENLIKNLRVGVNLSMRVSLSTLGTQARGSSSIADKVRRRIGPLLGVSYRNRRVGVNLSMWVSLKHLGHRRAEAPMSQTKGQVSIHPPRVIITPGQWPVSL